MKKDSIRLQCSLLGTVLILATASTCLGQWATQTIQLQPGWNAVYLSIHPFPEMCDQVFNNSPIVGAYRSNTRNKTAQFSTDPSKPFDRADEWLTWVPNDGVSGYVRTLEALSGGSAYLIRATNAHTLHLKGIPAIPHMDWVSGRPNLAGFQVSLFPDLQPLFSEFFRYEPAIDAEPYPDRTNIAMIGPGLESINITGQTARRKIEPGRAYWITAQSSSDFVGPLQVKTPTAEGMRYGKEHNELTVRILNTCNSNPAPLSVTIRHVSSETPPAGTPPSAGSVPLLYVDRTDTNWVWRPWPVEQSQTWDLTNGQILHLRLAINRGGMHAPANPNALWQSLLQISCNRGTFIQVPLSAAYDSGTDQLAAYPFGLWVGEAAIKEVTWVHYDSEIEGEATTGPLPAAGSFPMRLILHAGNDGTNRLLSAAVVAAIRNANSNVVHRIYTQRTNVPADATVVTRISSAAYGRIPPVGLSGSGFLGTLEGTYIIDYDDPLSPFKHVFHPDHDNLNTAKEKLPEGRESFSISNRIHLTWNVVPEPGLGATLWRPDETLTGTYEHEIYNLRRTPIVLRGPFTIRRVSKVGAAQ